MPPEPIKSVTRYRPPSVCPTSEDGRTLEGAASSPGDKLASGALVKERASTESGSREPSLRFTVSLAAGLLTAAVLAAAVLAGLPASPGAVSRAAGLLAALSSPAVL